MIILLIMMMIIIIIIIIIIYNNSNNNSNNNAVAAAADDDDDDDEEEYDDDVKSRMIPYIEILMTKMMMIIMIILLLMIIIMIITIIHNNNNNNSNNNAAAADDGYDDEEEYDDGVIKCKYFPRYWSFVWGIHRSTMNSPHTGQKCGALMFSLICAWINGWVNSREAGELRRHRGHYDVSVMFCIFSQTFQRNMGEHTETGIHWLRLRTFNGSFFFFLFLRVPLTHLPVDKMAPILQTIVSDAFSWIKSFVFWLKFHWSLFLRVQLTKLQYWFT